MFLLHGTPGCRLSGRHPDESRVVDAGLRLVTYDRPGYGQSARHKGRRVIDCVADVTAIADELGIDRFFVKGGSGGGPHALAVGATAPAASDARRVRRGCCAVRGRRHRLAGRDGCRKRQGVQVGAGAARTRSAPSSRSRQSRRSPRSRPIRQRCWNEFELSPADLAVLQDPRVQQRLRATTREAFANGVSGWVDDDLAFTVPWGFDVSELEVPVEIRYGATDVLVPAAHGAWLAAHVPNAIVTVDDTGGHLSNPDEGLEQLRELVTA